MKKPDSYLKEYCQKLPEETLKFLASRLNQRLSGDLPEALDFLSEVKEIDRWLSTANTCDELYDMIDLLDQVTSKEFEKRNVA